MRSDEEINGEKETLIPLSSASAKHDDVTDDVTVEKINEVLSTAEKRVVKFLSDKALNPIPYDPQGRILFGVGKDYEVSYDVTRNNALKNGYDLWVKTALQRALIAQKNADKTSFSEAPTLTDADNTDLDALVTRLNNLPSKSSIIALQQELHQHLALAARLYLKEIGMGKEADQKAEIQQQIKEAHASAMRRVNKFVSQAFAAALLEASRIPEEDPERFISTINQVLDQKCKEFVPKAHDILLTQIQRHTKNALEAAHFSSEKKVKRKALAEKTTASDRHFLHIDEAQKTITRIEGSNMTSHHRVEGAKLAHRSIRTYVQQGNSLQPQDRVWIRTPSLPLKKGLKGKAYIADTCKKLEHIAKHYFLEKPFTYNLLTALDSIRDGKNLQTQSTYHILLGAHEYNKTIIDQSNQINTGEDRKIDLDTKPMCYVQAISVNRAGRALGYYSYIPFVRQGFGWNINVQNEATLMAEMALMNNCCCKDSDRLLWTDITKQYQSFLQRQPATWLQRFLGINSVYLFKTKEGREICNKIADIKLSWQGSTILNSNLTVEEFSRLALQKMTAFDLHFSHDYAKLIQALSLYIEKKALFGCKSGNERTVIICGRAVALDQIDLLDEKSSCRIKTAFINLCEASTPQAAKAAADALRQELDFIYNNRCVYSASSSIPLLDQGAGHKIKSEDGTIRSQIDTNYAEDPWITSLSQDRTKAMQSHNDLVTYMHEAWDRWKPAAVKTDVTGVDGEMVANSSPNKMRVLSQGDHKGKSTASASTYAKIHPKKEVDNQENDRMSTSSFGDDVSSSESLSPRSSRSGSH